MLIIRSILELAAWETLARELGRAMRVSVGVVTPKTVSLSDEEDRHSAKLVWRFPIE